MVELLRQASKMLIRLEDGMHISQITRGGSKDWLRKQIQIMVIIEILTTKKEGLFRRVYLNDKGRLIQQH